MSLLYIKLIGLLGWTIFGMSIGLFVFSAVNVLLGGVAISLAGLITSMLILNVRDAIASESASVSENLSPTESELQKPADIEGEDAELESNTTKVLKVIPDNDPSVKKRNPEGIVSSFSMEGIPALKSTSIQEAVDNKDIIAPGAYAVIFPDGTHKIGIHPKNVNLGIMEDLTSLNDKAYYMKQSTFMDFIQLDELERWMQYIIENEKITNIHMTVHLSQDDFKKRELGKILEFRNIVNDYFESKS